MSVRFPFENHWFSSKSVRKVIPFENVLGWGHVLSLDDDGCFSFRTHPKKMELCLSCIPDANVAIFKYLQILLGEFVSEHYLHCNYTAMTVQTTFRSRTYRSFSKN